MPDDARILPADVIFHGCVRAAEWRAVAGPVRRIAEFEGIEDWCSHRLRLQFQNEFLIARGDGALLVATPNPVMLPDAECGAPVTGGFGR